MTNTGHATTAAEKYGYDAAAYAAAEAAAYTTPTKVYAEAKPEKKNPAHEDYANYAEWHAAYRAAILNGTIAAVGDYVRDEAEGYYEDRAN